MNAQEDYPQKKYNMKMKNWKTTLVGVIGLITLFIGFVLVYTGKVTLSDLGTFLTPVSIFLGAIVAILAGDGKTKEQ